MRGGSKTEGGGGGGAWNCEELGVHAQHPPRSLPPSHKKTSKARRIFKIDLKTGPTKKDKTKFIQNEIGATSLLEKKLEQPPADRICSDLDLGPDFVAEFKTDL